MEAVNSFQKLLALNTGKRNRKNKLLKKISNTKKLIKEKSDKNRTGNQKIKLNLWVELLDAEIVVKLVVTFKI